MKLLKHIRFSQPLVFVFALALAILLGLADYLGGYRMSFITFYFMPVAMTAWYVGMKPSFLVAVICGIAWYWAERMSGHTYEMVWLTAWNVGMRLAAFVTIGFLIGRIRSLVDSQRREIDELTDLLPICAKCKKIRDDEGFWLHIDEYFAKHHDITFTHGICKTCAAELYPEIAGKGKENGGTTSSVNSRQAAHPDAVIPRTGDSR